MATGSMTVLTADEGHTQPKRPVTNLLATFYAQKFVSFTETTQQ